MILRDKLAEQSGGAGSTVEERQGPIYYQIDPNVRDYTFYEVRLPNDTLFAKILVTNTSHGTYQARTEYWSITTDGFDQIGSATGLTFTGVAGDWPVSGFPESGALPTFTMPVDVSWDSLGGNPSVAFVTGGSAQKTGVRFDLVYSSSQWSGTITWYLSASSQPATGTHVLGPGTFVFEKTESPTPPSGQSWYESTHRPV